jgi:hypothetical protein
MGDVVEKVLCRFPTRPGVGLLHSTHMRPLCMPLICLVPRNLGQQAASGEGVPTYPSKRVKTTTSFSCDGNQHSYRVPRRPRGGGSVPCTENASEVRGEGEHLNIGTLYICCWYLIFLRTKQGHLQNKTTLYPSTSQRILIPPRTACTSPSTPDRTEYFFYVPSSRNLVQNCDSLTGTPP